MGAIPIQTTIRVICSYIMSSRPAWITCDLVFLFLFSFFFVLIFRDRVSLCSPSCPGTHFVDQAGLELRNLPASASQVLGLKACATTTRPVTSFDTIALYLNATVTVI